MERLNPYQRLQNGDEVPDTDHEETWHFLRVAGPSNPRKRKASGSITGTSTSTTKTDEYQLHQRSISIVSQGNAINPLNPDALTHVSSKRQVNFDYQSISSISGSGAFLPQEEHFFTKTLKKYKDARKWECNKDEYRSIAEELLFRSEEPCEDEFPDDGRWQSRRQLRFRETTGESLWRTPPWVLPSPPASQEDQEEHKAPYVIVPDITYSLVISGFPAEQWDIVRKWVYVQMKRWLCPYLTIEFKKDDRTTAKAQEQLAFYGAVVLYNRWFLWNRASGISKCDEGYDQIKHYCMLFEAGQYTVYVMKPKAESTSRWSGCEMTSIIEIDIHNSKSLPKLVLWINEIHAWGLTEHAVSCKKDIAVLISSGN